MPECAEAHLEQSRISNFFSESSPKYLLSVEGIKETEMEIGGRRKGLKGGDGKERGREGRVGECGAPPSPPER